MARQLAATAEHHPYYSQKLAFFAYEISRVVTEEAIQQAMEKLIASEKPVVTSHFKPALFFTQDWIPH